MDEETGGIDNSPFSAEDKAWMEEAGKREEALRAQQEAERRRRLEEMRRKREEEDRRKAQAQQTQQEAAVEKGAEGEPDASGVAATAPTPVRRLVASFAAGDSTGALEYLKGARNSGRLVDRLPEDDLTRRASVSAVATAGAAPPPQPAARLPQPTQLTLREFVGSVEERTIFWSPKQGEKPQCFQVGPFLFYNGYVGKRRPDIPTLLAIAEAQGEVGPPPFVMVTPLKMDMPGAEVFLMIVDTKHFTPFPAASQPTGNRFLFFVYVCRVGSSNRPRASPEVYFEKGKKEVFTLIEPGSREGIEDLESGYFQRFRLLVDLLEKAQPDSTPGTRYCAYFFTANVRQVGEKGGEGAAPVAGIPDAFLLRLLVNIATYLSARTQLWEKIQHGDHAAAGGLLKKQLRPGCCDWFYQEDQTGGGFSDAFQTTTHVSDSSDCAIARSQTLAKEFRLVDQMGWHPGLRTSSSADPLQELEAQMEGADLPIEAPARRVALLRNAYVHLEHREHVPPTPETQRAHHAVCAALRAWFAREEHLKKRLGLFVSEQKKAEDHAAQTEAAKKLAGQIVLYMDAYSFGHLTLAEQIQFVRMTVLDLNDACQYISFLNACITVAQNIYVLASCGEHADTDAGKDTAKQISLWLDALYICRHLEYHRRRTSEAGAVGDRNSVYTYLPGTGCAVCQKELEPVVKRLATEPTSPVLTYLNMGGASSVEKYQVSNVSFLPGPFKGSPTQAFGVMAFKELLSRVVFIYSDATNSGLPQEITSVYFGDAAATQVRSWEAAPAV